MKWLLFFNNSVFLINLHLLSFFKMFSIVIYKEKSAHNTHYFKISYRKRVKQSFNAYILTILWYAMVCDSNDMLWNFAMRFVHYVMRNWNERLYDMVCKAMVCYEIWTKIPSYKEEIKTFRSKMMRPKLTTNLQCEHSFF